MQRLRALGRALITTDTTLGTPIGFDIILISIEQHTPATQILLVVRTVGIGQELVIETTVVGAQD
jgi:hypothetical protein